MKRALICGISGQDGAYLARLLLGKGYEVWGTSRDAAAGMFFNLSKLGIRDQVRVISMEPAYFKSVLRAASDSRPDEIYNLSGQSSVALSFIKPVETLTGIAAGAFNLLEAIRFLDMPVRYFSAGSSECFGNTGVVVADENTLFNPLSPYAEAKAAAHRLVEHYRNAHGLFACNGILFNHESPLRPPRFVTRKIVQAAVRIANGSKEKLTLGHTGVQRDWGLSSEYVEAMWRVLQTDVPQDFVIATGETNPLEAFVDCAFSYAGLDWRRHVVRDASLCRPCEIRRSCGNPEKAGRILGWKAATAMQGVVREMMRAEGGITLGNGLANMPLFSGSTYRPVAEAMVAYAGS